MSATAESIYLSRQTERQCYLQEAFRSAEVTIPSIMPSAEDICNRNSPVVLEKPVQSLGARGVNNLSSKLLLALFPPTAPFMNYKLTGEAREEAEETETDISKLKSQLARREARIQDEVEIQGLRSKVFAAIKQLLVCGDVMGYFNPTEGGIKIYKLNSYVVKRDGKGRLLDLIYVDKLDRMNITHAGIQKILQDQFKAGEESEAGGNDPDEPVLLFTRVMRTSKNSFKSWQEVEGVKIPGTEDTHKEKTLPWLTLRYTAIDGEDYGRGFVEEIRGELTGLEQLTRDLRFISANSAKLVWGIDPNSPLRVKDFLNANNGGAVRVGSDDIHAIRVDKGGDVNTIQVDIARMEQALKADFMLNASFQRNQERVTAEEIRRLAEELEDTLGGVFSLFSQELQLPVANLLEAYLIRTDKTFKPLPQGSVRIGVVTGLAAIGRGQDLQRLRGAIDLFKEAAPVLPSLPRYLDPENFATRIMTGSGVDADGLLKTQDQVNEEIQAEQQTAAAETTGSELARGAGNAVGQLDPEQVAAGLQAATGQS